MATGNSSYDYILQDNPHNPNNNHDYDYNYTYNSNAVKAPVYKEKPVTESRPEITMKITPPKKGSAVKFFFIALFAFGIFFFVINGRVQINQLYRQISQQTELLEIAQSENVRMRSDLEGQMTLKNIEEYAEDVLGLQKLDNSQIKYVETQTDDIIEIPDEDKSLYTKIIDKFNGFVEYIFG